MFSAKFSVKHLVSALALSGCLLTGLQAIAWADGNPGLTIFSGVERKDILDYFLDYGGHPNEWDRYKLYVPSKKIPQGVSKFYISYPEHFDGKFDKESIQVRVKGKPVPLSDVTWDKESRFIEIDLAQPIEANTKVDIVLSNVKNPTYGTYYFVCDAQASGDIPIRYYVGTWILSISR
jgi:hypothetical protein